jgi:hypothetical protein
MIGAYCVQFERLRPSEVGAVFQESPARICIACAAGHHEQPVLAHESCDCPCHGTPPAFADSGVAA